MLLRNRLALLKAEEEKAWKKIEQTKERANELIKQREENVKRANAKKKMAEQIERDSMKLQQRRMQQQSTISVKKVRNLPGQSQPHD